MHPTVDKLKELLPTRKTPITNALLLLLAIYLLKITLRRTRHIFHPVPHPKLRPLPTPPSDLLLGHVRLIPFEATWLTFAAWYKQYGEVIFVKTLGNPMVVVNTVAAAHGLLEKKGANFSTRPPFYYFKDWYARSSIHCGTDSHFLSRLGWSDSLPFMPYNENHRRQRRLIRPHLSFQAIPNYQQAIYNYAQLFVDKLRTSAEDHSSHAHECVIFNF